MPALPTDIAKRFKDSLLEAMPLVLDDYLVMVRGSENPEDFRKFLEFGAKLNGLEPKSDANANLPVFNITISGAGVKAIDVTQSAEAQPQPQALEAVSPSDSVPVPAPQPFTLEMSPID